MMSPDLLEMPIPTASASHGPTSRTRWSVSTIGMAGLHQVSEAGPNTSFFQSGFAFELYSKTPGCRPLAWIVQTESGAVLATILAVQFSESRWAPDFISSHTTVRGGPALFTATGSSMNEIAHDLVSTVVKESPETLYIRFYQVPLQAFPVAALESFGLTREDWFNVEFILEGASVGELERRLKPDKRKAIRRARRNNLEVDFTTSTADMEAFIGLLRSTAVRKRFWLQDPKLFWAVHHDLIPRGMARLLVARKGGCVIAARLLLTYKGVVTDWYAASTPEAEELNANEMLVWKAIEWSLQDRAACFDFGGAGSSTTDYGVGRFKARFGGDVVNTGRYTWTRRPFLRMTVERALRARRAFLGGSL